MRWSRLLTFRDDMGALPTGARGSILTLAATSFTVGVILLMSPPSRLSGPGFRPADAIGLPALAAVFVLIGVGLAVARFTGFGTIFWLRAHSLYWSFWACMFGVAWWFYGTSGVGVPVYLALGLWSMLLVATVRQWRRLQARKGSR